MDYQKLITTIQKNLDFSYSEIARNVDSTPSHIRQIHLAMIKTPSHKLVSKLNILSKRPKLATHYSAELDAYFHWDNGLFIFDGQDWKEYLDKIELVKL